jgi:hypothetical protein
MGNHRLKHYQSRINATPPIVSEVAFVETQKQHAKRITQSFDANITTTRA